MPLLKRKTVPASPASSDSPVLSKQLSRFQRRKPSATPQEPQTPNETISSDTYSFLDSEQPDPNLFEDLGDLPTTTAPKRPAYWQKEMAGKPVFLEDTGERLGEVADPVLDAEQHLIGYRIKDNKSDAVLSFPLEQFDEDRNGLIFVPSWYSKGVKTVEKLEFKDRITPELMWLITDNTVPTQDLYRVFVRHDDSITGYLEEASSLRELLTQRLRILEKERLSLKESLMDLTEKRLIKDIDRREFSDVVIEHRRKVNVLDNNMKKCSDLLARLQKTSFGILSLALHTTTASSPDSHPDLDPITDHSYQEKYYQLKQQYTKLHEGYEELKTAVERLLTSTEA